MTIAAQVDPLSLTFSALADPTRRRMLAMLAQGQRSVKELAEPFALSQPAISKHLKVLERAGLVKRERQAQWRPARLEAEPLREAADWMEEYRQHWEQRFDRLESYLEHVQAEDASKDPKGKQ